MLTQLQELLTSKKTLLVGLGNPEKQLFNTRHNVGFKFVDYLVEHFKQNYSVTQFKLTKSSHLEYFSKLKIYTLKPQTYMNLSGKSVLETMNYIKIPTEQIIVVYDDLDIKLGEYKLQFANHPKGHNGLNSIITSLNSDLFYNLRIGIASEERIPEQSGKDFVLTKFSPKELTTLKNALENIIKDNFSIYS